MKRKSHFHFKKFSMRDDQCAMKVGTDAVLLGAWSNIGSAQYILDIGTGSGVIALMMAQRSMEDAHIDGVEIEAQDAAQAAENVIHSPWPLKVSIHHTPVQNFSPEYFYDIIISNPPFFINSQHAPDKRRTQTRHTTSLNHEALILAVKKLLKTSGKFNVILPSAEGLLFIDQAISGGLYCTRKFSFKTRADKPVERWLLEFSNDEATMESGEIILYEAGLTWSVGYRDLTGNFYL